MASAHTEADFDRLSWHDCQLYALRLRPGDPPTQRWTSELELDIDFIVDWLCGTDRRPRFRVAPATLVFHDVADLRIRADWGDSRHRVALSAAAIDAIEREPLFGLQVHFDRPYFRWSIRLNAPSGGEIAFGASGFTQTLRAEPVSSDEQCLPPDRRSDP